MSELKDIEEQLRDLRETAGKIGSDGHIQDTLDEILCDLDEVTDD